VQAAQRDPARFGDLYEAHFERIYAFIARRVRGRDIAEDLTAEVFHRALANLRNFEWRGAPFSTWLVRIAANLLADQAKLSAREGGNPGAAPEPSVEADFRTSRITRVYFASWTNCPPISAG